MVNTLPNASDLVIHKRSLKKTQSSKHLFKPVLEQRHSNALNLVFDDNTKNKLKVSSSKANKSRFIRVR